MFRQFLHIIISLLFVISTSGIVVSKHYCGGVLSNVSIYLSADNCCNDTCDSCRNDNLVLQVDDDFSIVQTMEKSSIFHLDIEKVIKQMYNIGFDDLPVFDYNIVGPPPDKVNVILSKYQLYLC